MSTDKVETGSNVEDIESRSIDEHRLMTKIDLRLLPVLSLCYLVAFLDRINVGNAVVFGLTEELGLEGNQFNVALCIFFIPYILLEIPSNSLLKRFKPHQLLSFCVFMFGLTTILQGFVTNYKGLLTTRFFLGFFETGMFPGSFYLLSMWYKRSESQKRFSFFFVSTALGGAFGGLLATAIGKMDGVGGKLAWRWIFILEGFMTCVVGVIGYFLLPDFPEDVRWLSASEKKWVVDRLRADVGASGKENPTIRLRDLRVIFTDYKFSLGTLMYMGFVVPGYGFAYFAPTILKGWHYSSTQSQLRTVPVSIVAWLVAMAIATASDHTKHRYLYLLLCALLSSIGLILLLTTHFSQGAQYTGMFFLYSGAMSGMPMAACYFQTNLAGHKRRSIGSAFQIGFGNVGGIVATFLFLAKDAPYYRSGYAVTLGFVGLAALAGSMYVLGIRRENRLKEEGRAGVTEGEEVEGEVGDRAKAFRYML